MAKKQKVRKFVKEHAPEIIAWTGVVGGALIGATGMYIHKSNPMPHKLMVRSDSKDFIDALRAYVNWNGGKKFESCHLGYGLTGEQVRNYVEELLKEDSNEHLYGLMLEKAKK